MTFAQGFKLGNQMYNDAFEMGRIRKEDERSEARKAAIEEASAIPVYGEDATAEMQSPQGAVNVGMPRKPAPIATDAGMFGEGGMNEFNAPAPPARQQATPAMGRSLKEASEQAARAPSVYDYNDLKRRYLANLPVNATTEDYAKANALLRNAAQNRTLTMAQRAQDSMTGAAPNMDAAAWYAQEALSAAPDGNSYKVVNMNGTLVGVATDERTGKPSGTFGVTPDMIGKYIEKFKDPMTWGAYDSKWEREQEEHELAVSKLRSDAEGASLDHQKKTIELQAMTDEMNSHTRLYGGNQKQFQNRAKNLRSMFEKTRPDKNDEGALPGLEGEGMEAAPPSWNLSPQFMEDGQPIGGESAVNIAESHAQGLVMANPYVSEAEAMHVGLMLNMPKDRWPKGLEMEVVADPESVSGFSLHMSNAPGMEDDLSYVMPWHLLTREQKKQSPMKAPRGAYVTDTEGRTYFTYGKPSKMEQVIEERTGKSLAEQGPDDPIEAARSPDKSKPKGVVVAPEAEPAKKEALPAASEKEVVKTIGAEPATAKMQSALDVEGWRAGTTEGTRMEGAATPDAKTMYENVRKELDAAAQSPEVQSLYGELQASLGKPVQPPRALDVEGWRAGTAPGTMNIPTAPSKVDDKEEGVKVAQISQATKTLVNAIAQAETGSYRDPWIRTGYIPAEGSTAYGPLQLTGKLAKDMIAAGEKLYTKEELKYLDKFLAQSKKFAMYGDNPHWPMEKVKSKKGYDPRYDYGGKGDLDTPEDRKMYWQVTSKWLDRLMKKYKGDALKVAREWRFGAESKKQLRENDPRYLGALVKVLNP